VLHRPLRPPSPPLPHQDIYPGALATRDQADTTPPSTTYHTSKLPPTPPVMGTRFHIGILIILIFLILPNSSSSFNGRFLRAPPPSSKKIRADTIFKVAAARPLQRPTSSSSLFEHRAVESSLLPLPSHPPAPQSSIYLSATYNNLLLSSPLLTKSLTCAIITLISDIIAQSLESRSGSSLAHHQKFNFPRLLSFTITSAVLVGPFVHCWYNKLFSFSRKLETKNPDKRIPKSLIVILQVLIDQTFGVALFLPLYFVGFGIISGVVTMALNRASNPITLGLLKSVILNALNTAQLKLRTELKPILIQQYKFWPIVNVFNFGLVPEQYRVLFSNFASLFWQIYLCAAMGGEIAQTSAKANL
jgi:hypothetical protein